MGKKLFPIMYLLLFANVNVLISLKYGHLNMKHPEESSLYELLPSATETANFCCWGI